MKIADWKKSRGFTNQEIAAQLAECLGCHVSHETVRLHVAGSRLPSREIAFAYWQISGGVIDGNDHYDLPIAAPSPNASSQPEAAR